MEKELIENYPNISKIIIGILTGTGIALINFLATKIYSKIANNDINFFWRVKYKPLLKLSPNRNLDELKKRLRIVVIDDEPTFPTKLFKDYGYSIDEWFSVQDIKKLEDGFYDIIILDIGNVANEISENDGLGVLERLKKQNPVQIVIAYSGQSFDLTKQRFWELADEKIAKPSKFIKIQDILENIILNKINSTYYIDTLKKVLAAAGLESNNFDNIEKELYYAIKENKEPNWNVVLDFLKEKKEYYIQIKSICLTILKYYKN